MKIRMDVIGFLGCECFLDGIVFLMSSKQVLVLRESSHWGWQHPCLVRDVRSFPCTHFEFYTHCGPWNYGLMYTNRDTKSEGVYRLFSCYASLPHQTLVTNLKFKDKIMRNFKKATTEHATEHRALLNMGLRETTEVACP